MIAFDIEVLNVNDKPMISGIPSQYYMPLKVYRFKPTVRDIDMDINKDKLWFTIENKPHWSTFNNKNSELSGKPKFSEDDINLDIIISVSVSHGLSATLQPFNIDVAATQAANLYKPTKFISQNENISSYLNISYGFFDYSKAIKSFETIETYSKTSTSIKHDQENDINQSTKSESKPPNIKIKETAKEELKTKIIKHNDPPGVEIAENNNQIRIETIKYQNIDQNRPVISQPTATTLKFTETSIIEDKKTSPENIGSIKQPQESNPVVANKQSYNPFSVMNYCTNATDYFANHVKANNLLSDADINRVQQFYGAPSDTEPHLMDENDFFTGLYRATGENEYVFYKFGAPYSHPKIDLSQIGDQQYFVIYDDKQDESVLFKFDNNMQYLKPVNDLLAVCNSLESPNNNTNAISMNCSAIWNQERYSNNIFYYFDDAYGFDNEFNSLFCEEIEGTLITESDITYHFLRLSDYDCVDFDQDMYKPFFFTKNKNQLFIKGKGYSGRLDGLPNLSFDNGQLKYDRLEQQNNQLKRFNPKYNSFVGYSGYIKTLHNNPSINSGYYVAGSKINERNTKLVNEKFEWGGVDIIHAVIYSFKEQEGRKQLFKHAIPFTGYYNHESYSNGYKDELEIVEGKIYRFNRENYDANGNKLHDILGYQHSPTYFSWHSGFNPSSLGNGKNAYYAQGYPATMLCRSNGKCSNQNDSIEDIYQKFKDVNKDDIFAWINVRTQYSVLNVNGKICPILFKGHNPFTGYFNGNKYKSGYLVMKD
jgi:hypothetical protein